jgi:hypothetical protein
MKSLRPPATAGSCASTPTPAPCCARCVPRVGCPMPGGLFQIGFLFIYYPQLVPAHDAAAVTALCVAGPFIITGSDDKRLKVWEGSLSNPTPQTFVGHVAGISALAYCDATHTLISAGEVALLWHLDPDAAAAVTIAAAAGRRAADDSADSRSSDHSLLADPNATFALDDAGLVRRCVVLGHRARLLPCPDPARHGRPRWTIPCCRWPRCRHPSPSPRRCRTRYSTRRRLRPWWRSPPWRHITVRDPAWAGGPSHHRQLMRR